MPGTPYPLEVTPRIPPRLGRLAELANNLWYSWDRPTRALFSRLHPGLWRGCGHSPKAFLKRVDQKRLDAAAEDPVFLSQNWKFTAPVYIGDTITAEAEVLSVHGTKPVCQLRVRITRQTGETVLEGEAWCYRFGPTSSR